MKRVSIFIMVFLIVILVGCTERPPLSNNIPTDSASKTPELSVPETVQSTAPKEGADTSPATSVPTDEISVNSDRPLPSLLRNQWYDFDKVGAYPGASVVQCGDKIAYRKIKYGEGMDFDSHLSFADPDGSNCEITDIKNYSNLNYKDGWVYIIYKKDCIYKVKTDGSGLSRVFKAQSNIAGTTEIRLSNLLLVEGKLYVFENNIKYGVKQKTTFVRMNLDGSGAEVLNRLDSFGYSCSPFYDSGKLYYINMDLNNPKAELYEYDIEASKNICLSDKLAMDYAKIAVRGDKVYHKKDLALYVYTISTGKDELFALTENRSIYDFGFFDRWLLITSDYGLYFHDLQTGKLFLCNEGDITGNALDIIPTRQYVYLESQEDYPILYQVTFQDGGINVGDAFNEIK